MCVWIGVCGRVCVCVCSTRQEHKDRTELLYPWPGVWMGVRVCADRGVWTGMCARARARVCVCVCVDGWCVCAHACVCMWVNAWVSGCVRACVHVCVW